MHSTSPTVASLLYLCRAVFLCVNQAFHMCWQSWAAQHVVCPAWKTAQIHSGKLQVLIVLVCIGDGCCCLLVCLYCVFFFFQNLELVRTET